MSSTRYDYINQPCRWTMQEGTTEEASRPLHEILKRVCHDTMTYSAANDSLCKNIAELHLTTFTSSE